MTGEVAALAAAVAFGLSTVTARRFMDTVTPEAGALVSIAMNVVVFWSLAALAALRQGAPLVPAKAVALFVVGGLAGTLLGRNLSYLSIERIGPSLQVTIRLSQTLLTLLFGLLILGEFPRAWQFAGLVAVVGGVWISLRSRAAIGATEAAVSGEPARPLDIVAVLLALGAAVAFAFGDTTRRAGLVIAPMPVLGAAIGATAAFCAHLVWSIARHSARWPAGPALRGADLWISAAFNTMAILLLYAALRSAPVAVVSTLYNLQVLVVIVGSRFLLGDRDPIRAGLVAGSALALAGTAMILLG